MWRRTWRALRRGGGEIWRLVVSLGVVLAVMNACFYLAIDRLPLGTVAAIEFLPVIGLAALGVRSVRNLPALALAVAGVYALVDIRFGGEPLAFVFAFANAALFASYSLLVALLPATALVVGVVVLAQIPHAVEILGVSLVVAAVALHRESGGSA